LGRNPQLFNYFNEANQRSGPGVHDGLSAACPSKQSKTLADAVVAYAANIDHLENLSEAVERISHKHCALQLAPEHYQYVHDNLLEAIGEVLGAAVTPEVAAAWSEAIMALSKIFIATEEKLYGNAKKEQWLGVKEFTISAIMDEATDVKSFRFQAKDGTKKGFTPGQYITIFEKPAGKEFFAPRHYTVTSQPEDDYYQVTVKRLHDPNDPENKAHDGFYSNFLHSCNVGDTIHCGAVYGPDLLEAGDKTRAAAFVSVGIGLTPTKAMLASAAATRPKVAVFHGNSDPEHQAYGNALEMDVEKLGGIWKTFYSRVEGGERMSAQKILDTLKAEAVDPTSVDYYICAGGS
ncbi:hypothetical protein ACHAWF_007343, partial [Thalassiosira exigua]